MYLKMLKGKIHRAVVKQAELNYVGSITVDPRLMEAAGILEYENVQIVDIAFFSAFSPHLAFYRRQFLLSLPKALFFLAAFFHFLSCDRFKKIRLTNLPMLLISGNPGNIVFLNP